MKIRVFVISDIGFLIDHIRELFKAQQCDKYAEMKVFCSPGSEQELSSLHPSVSSLSVKDNWQNILENYDLVISYHCRQLFPKQLVEKVRCLNIHPGYNPYNRGWYPGVFSIYNGLPAGATIHEIDAKIDHGPIIARKQVEILPEDTSGTLYPKIIEAENELLDHWLEPILKNNYSAFMPEEEGNVNYKKDFDELCNIDLDEMMPAIKLISKLKALTHGEFNNAFFKSPINGKRIYLSLRLEVED